MRAIQCLLLLALLLWQVSASPAVLTHDASAHPSLSELTARVATRAPRLTPEARLPLPSPQDLEAIKKVAQILAMLGEQVIPAIIGEPPGACAACDADDPPPDPVSNN